MDDVWSKRVGDVVTQLEDCLRSHGNFSIEQQPIRDTDRKIIAVLLRICQREVDRKPKLVLGFVIDKKMKIGYCTKNMLRLGENPMLVKRSYVFHPETFRGWVTNFRPLRPIRIMAA